LSFSAVNVTFAPTSGTLRVGLSTTITLNNQDEGVQHDLVIFDPSGAQVTATALKSGPSADSAVFTPGVAGAYPFKCSVHPQQMRGVITVQ
jgi:plastocyanin